MDTRYIKLFIFFIAVEISMDFGDACQPCTHNHLQQLYCDNTIVLKAKILLVELPKDRVDFFKESEYEFVMSVKAIFKGGELIGLGKRYGKANLRCTFPLVEGETMLIMGTAMQTGGVFIYGVDRCNGVMRWNHLSKIQIQGLKRKYRRNCETCKITACYNKEFLHQNYGECPHKKDPCFFSNKDSTCHYKHSYCVQKKGKCKWVKTKALKTCLRNKQIDE